MKPNGAGGQVPRQVVIIGAGVAGLCCALRLQEKNIPCVVLEASDAPGGRVRTDTVDGFLLDRGFQVLLTAYPEARRLLDYKALGLRTFAPGALVRVQGKLHRVSDPFRQPWTLPSTLLAPIGSLADKLAIARLRSHVRRGTAEEIWSRPETSSLEALQSFGFSQRMIDSFFRPFFGGIFLETELATSSRLLEFVFRMFGEGQAALPAAGMGAIPEQLAARLAPGTLRTGARVELIGEGKVVLRRGERVPAAAVVIAAEAPEAARLLPDLHPPAFHNTACLYFAASRAPVGKPILVLNGEGGRTGGQPLRAERRLPHVRPGGTGPYLGDRDRRRRRGGEGPGARGAPPPHLLVRDHGRGLAPPAHLPDSPGTAGPEEPGAGGPSRPEEARDLRLWGSPGDAVASGGDGVRAAGGGGGGGGLGER